MSSSTSSISTTTMLMSSVLATASSTATSIPHITTQRDRSDDIFVVALIMTILATTFVVMRMISKTWVVRKVMWDDYITILAWAFFIVMAAATISGSRNGLGKIGVDIRPEWAGPLRKATYTFTVFYNPATMTIKLAILLLYRRMSEVQPWFRYGTYGTMTIVTLAGVVCTFIAIFQCRPVSAAWDSDKDDAKCIDVIALFLSSAPVNILTDLSILLLPLPILTSLRMEMRQKVALIATFCVGGFVTVVDVVRISYLQQALKAERIYGDHGELNASTQFGDFTYYISLSLMWSFIEISVGLMCSCTLVLKPLILRVMPAILRKKREARMTQQETHALTYLSESPVRGEKSPSPKSPEKDQQQEFLQLPIGRLDMNENAEASGSGSGSGSGSAPNSINGREGEGGRDSSESDVFDFLAILKEDPPQSNNKGGQTGNFSKEGNNNLMVPQIKQVPSDNDIPNHNNNNGKSQKLGRSASNGHGINTKNSYLHKLRTRKLSGSTKKSGSTGVHHIQGPTDKFFDFVNMSGNKPLTELGAREALGPILFVSILFFLWGFSYGLIGNLNGEIEDLLGFKPHESLGLQSAYWAAYLVGPICIGYWILVKMGFKATFVAGLTIYSAGAMAFWPSAVLTSYPGFVISNFMVALGLSTLETAANPFIALAGPGEYSEARLLFSQAIQAIGSLASTLIAQRALFNNVDQMRLFKVQWCYLAVAIFVLILAAIFYYVPLSEATDEDLEIKAHRRFEHAGIQPTCKSFGIPTRWVLLVGGVFVMANYVSAQECISFSWGAFVPVIKPTADTRWMKTIGQALFFASRLSASFGCYVGIPPRLVLGFCILGTFITALIPMIIKTGNGALTCLLLHMFFEGPIFPLIFAMIIRGQGKHTKSASAALTSAISAATIFPIITYKIEEFHPNFKLLALTVVCVLYGVSSFLPIILTLNRNLRNWIEPKWSLKRIGDKIAPDHEDPYHLQLHHHHRFDPPHHPNENYNKQTRQDLGLESIRSDNGIVGLGVNLNGGNLNEITSLGSIRGIRDFDIQSNR